MIRVAPQPPIRNRGRNTDPRHGLWHICNRVLRGSCDGYLETIARLFTFYIMRLGLTREGCEGYSHAYIR